jgi:hypothetical protein
MRAASTVIFLIGFLGNVLVQIAHKSTAIRQVLPEFSFFYLFDFKTV